MDDTLFAALPPRETAAAEELPLHDVRLAGTIAVLRLLAAAALAVSLLGAGLSLLD